MTWRDAILASSNEGRFEQVKAQMTHAPTMKDVALEAGVALKTVSRFVNGETNINPAMSARIAAAITTLGYRRNLAAASLRPGHSGKTLGLIISDLANPYFSNLARAIESHSAERGYLLISSSSDEDGGRHDRLVDRLVEQRVDGLIVVPPRSAGRGWSDVTPPIPPLVVLDRPVDFASADTILADNEGGAYEGTRALLADGARRVAFLGDSLDLYTMQSRYRGYQRALRDAGIPDEVVAASAHSVSDAEAATSELIETGSIDAIFAANNRGAIGSLRAFGATGRRIPLIGFDDFEAATVTTPGVSVVAQDIAEMGRLAAEIAIARATGDTSEYTTRVLPTKLILRGSERR